MSRQQTIEGIQQRLNILTDGALAQILRIASDPVNEEPFRRFNPDNIFLRGDELTEEIRPYLARGQGEIIDRWLDTISEEWKEIYYNQALRSAFIAAATPDSQG